MRAANVEKALTALADPLKKEFFPRFFKTGQGEYAEGDVFLGVTVPNTRSVVRTFRTLPLQEVITLLKSPFHECRLAVLLILIEQFNRGTEGEKQEIVDIYTSHADYVNNWDLVDTSAPTILGAWLHGKDTSLLDTFAASTHLWKQRIAIVATLYFIRKGELTHTFRIAESLLHHRHDLIHKAVGWMLREAGKRNPVALDHFLLMHHRTMPRTMLRYALEKLPPARKMQFMAGVDA